MCAYQSKIDPNMLWHSALYLYYQIHLQELSDEAFHCIEVIATNDTVGYMEQGKVGSPSCRLPYAY